MDPDLLQAIERAIYLVEPHLKQAGGYPARYRDVVLRVLNHAEQVAAAIPGPVVLDREHYVRDPFVHAVFASPDDIRHTLGLSRAMLEFQRQGAVPGADVYALMGMRRNEKNIFGMETEGDQVRRDVAQQTVTFSDHTLSCVSASESETRAALIWEIFDSLMGRVTRRVEALRQEKDALDKEKDNVMARLRGSSAERRVVLQGNLEEVMAKLRDITAQLDLRRVAKLFDELLQTPEVEIRLESQRIRLDGMGILRRAEEGVISHSIQFTELFGLDRRRWTVVLVRCLHQELPPMADRLESANRWLSA